ncbi:MAG: rhodanese-like domain-containing protein [Bacteroidota bacterium]
MLLFFAMLSSTNAQQPTTGNEAFDAELNRLLNYSVPVISVDELKAAMNNYKIFDARELNEYLVSHLPGAVHIGFTDFKKDIFDEINKDEKIVLYCSVGYRSEKIGEKLQKMGFENVLNLYGSIFEWANKGYPVENFTDKNTKEIHTYNEKWGEWVTNPTFRKVW